MQNSRESVMARSRGVAICAVSCVAVAACLAGANTGPIRQLTLDPNAEIVPLFEGTDADQFGVQMIATSAYQANVLVANKTAAPLTVALPKAAVGVHVLPQFNPIGGGNNGFLSGGQNGFGNGQQSAQGVGGPFQGSGLLQNNNPFNNAGNNNFFGQGFPSVPAELVHEELKQFGGLATIPAGKSILLKMNTVCLDYGRGEPRSGLTYHLIPVETHSSDPVLAELLENYSQRVDREVMQAAAWHVANHLSWEQVSRLPDRRIPGSSATLFNRRQVEAARQLVASAEEAAKTRPQTRETPVPDVARHN